MKYEYITDNSIKSALKYGNNNNDIYVNINDIKLQKKLKKQLLKIKTSNYAYIYKLSYYLTLKNGNTYVFNIFNDVLNNKKEEYKNNHEIFKKEIKLYYMTLIYCISKNNMNFEDFKKMVIEKINN
jgi:hypothetical protein